jgi:hypothetical protein
VNDPIYRNLQNILEASPLRLNLDGISKKIIEVAVFL